jgi:hypothetical protein
LNEYFDRLGAHESVTQGFAVLVDERIKLAIIFGSDAQFLTSFWSYQSPCKTVLLLPT